MRFFILLIFIISCGKHESPPAMDLGDNDGDQKSNSFETGPLAKNIADIESLGHVKGMMSFHYEKEIQVQFSNRFNFKEDLMKTMVSRESEHLRNDYYDEWMKLHLEKNQKISSLPNTNYTVHLHFQTSEVSPEELILVDEKAEYRLGKWSPYMKLNLSGDDLNALLSGKAYFRIKKKFFQGEFHHESSEETIKEKTYRLYFDNGKNTSLLYISHQLPIEEFIKLKGLKNLGVIQEEELFFSLKEQSSKKWFLRSFSNGDQVLALTTIQDVNQEYLKRFHYRKTKVQRSNGVPDKGLSLANKEAADVYLRLRARKTKRTFVEQAQKRTYSEGGGGGKDGNGVFRWTCIHYLRNVKNETFLSPDLNEIAQNINLNLDRATKIEEKIDEKGIYWDIKMDSVEPNFVLNLAPKDKATYVITGQYDNSCKNQSGGNSASYKTNPEGQFLLEVESYVEKLP